MKNPFAQSAHYQSLTLYCLQYAVEAVEAALDGLVLSTAAFEDVNEAAPLKPEHIRVTPHKLTGEVWGEALQPDAEMRWRMDMVVEDHATRQEAETRLILLKESGAPLLSWHWQDLEMRDWAAELQAQFPPLAIGRFYIHGSHLPAPLPPQIPLRIDAGRAFGTGEHATTSGCLLALENLARTQRPRRILDLGCGTGILAIAAQKLWPEAEVIGTDMDAVSIQVAKENAKQNHTPQTRFYTACGFQHPALHGQKFDLIFANILARPLIKLAGGVRDHLQPGGYAILSGLLCSQALQVTHAYHARGFALHQRYPQGDWMAMTVRKSIK